MKKKYIKPKSIDVQLDPDELLADSNDWITPGGTGGDGDIAESKYNSWDSWEED